MNQPHQESENAATRPNQRRKPRRSRLRRSVVILGMSLLALALTPILWKLHQARQEAQAVAALDRFLGAIVFDDGMIFVGTTIKPCKPHWTTKVFGADLTRHVVGFSLDLIFPRERKAFDDAMLAHVVKLPYLRRVFLRGCAITDEGLKVFRNAEQVEVLYLSYVDVSDQGLSYLRECPHLKELNLLETNVTPAGVAEFRQARPDVKVAYQ